MNLSRAFSAIPSTKRYLLRSLSLFQSPNLSTAAAAPTTPKSSDQNTEEDPLGFPDADSSVASVPKPAPDPGNWPRPAEIPWQPKVANSVQLIGSIAIPVQIDVAPDGRYWAVSVLRQEKALNFPQLWIPIVFEGDLAQIAACHLKEKDLVYVTGHISGEPPPFTIEQGPTSIQVMVHNLSYVQKSWMMKRPLEQNELASKRLEQNELASNCSGNTTKNAENEENLWQDLINNPKHFWDNRLDKKNGLVKPRFPDFKHKETSRPLWLDSAPKWIQTQLERVEFDVKHFYPKQEGKSMQQDSGANKTILKESKESNLPKKSSKAEKEVSWKDLLENPGNWWDNRPSKINPKSPDFKHKVTGEGLWIVDSATPTWVLPNLPPVKPKQEVNVAMGNTHQS